MNTTKFNQGALVEIEDVLTSKDSHFKYMMLGRLKQDCDYYLGFGGRDKERLWADDEATHIECMKRLHCSFPDGAKPTWLSMEQIDSYEKSMLPLVLETA